MPVSVEHFLAGFDSTTAMLEASTAFLGGAGGSPLVRMLAGLTRNLNRLPPAVRQKLYTAAGWADTVPPELLDEFRVGELADWVVRGYPDRPAPAVALGSSNGAGVFLFSALGVPWLPQTFLLPVAREGIDPDDPRAEVDGSREPAERLLEANPGVSLHHMLDPVQERLNSRVRSHFRIKLLRLEEPYRRYIRDHLSPGGFLFLVDCRLKWPATAVSQRHVFQFGGCGGASTRDYFENGEPAEGFLRQQGSGRPHWDPPQPDGERPEAEWGYTPEWDPEILEFARENGYRVFRIAFDHPEDLSPLAADLYLRAYRRRNIGARRLLAPSFSRVDPYWTLRTAATPFWLLFATDPSLDNLERYLGEREFDEIGLTLFSPGLEAIGAASQERCRSILARARRRGLFVGMNDEAFPIDLSVFDRSHTGIREAFPARYPLPGPLSLEFLDRFLDEHRQRYAVEWREEAG